MNKQAEEDLQKLELQVKSAEEQHGAESLQVLYLLEDLSAFCRDHNLKLEEVNSEARANVLRKKLKLSQPDNAWKPRSIKEMTKLEGLLQLGVVFFLLAMAMVRMDREHLVIPAYVKLLTAGAGLALIIYAFTRP